MPQTMDALKSFSYLIDNLPLWLTKLDELSVQVTEQHTRFTRLTQYTEVKLARKKHDSTESLRPKANDKPEPTAIVVTDTSVPPSSQPVSSNAVILKDTTRNILRKRKPGSALSGASGPQRYRTRSMIVVYYDSVIQDAFEQLVRNIAGARNNLRKGKTAASFKNRMAAMGIGIGIGGDPAGGAGRFPLLDPKMRLKIGINRQIPGLEGTTTDAAFETMDRDLEKAQSLCEVAAHQMLRDGDCREEIGETKERFENCLKTAKEEAEKMREKEAREKEAEALEAAEEAQKPEEVVQVTTSEPPRPEPVEIFLPEKVEHPMIKDSTFAGTGAIEVDNESDASSIKIDLSAIRRTRRV